MVGECDLCEAGCWSRWHLWPSTTVVDAGPAPFLPHWAHTHLHAPDSTFQLFHLHEFTVHRVISNQNITSQLRFIVFLSVTLTGGIFPFIAHHWPTLYKQLTAILSTCQTAKQDHWLTKVTSQYVQLRANTRSVRLFHTETWQESHLTAHTVSTVHTCV